MSRSINAIYLIFGCRFYLFGYKMVVVISVLFEWRMLKSKQIASVLDFQSACVWVSVWYYIIFQLLYLYARWNIFVLFEWHRRRMNCVLFSIHNDAYTQSSNAKIFRVFFVFDLLIYFFFRLLFIAVMLLLLAVIFVIIESNYRLLHSSWYSYFSHRWRHFCHTKHVQVQRRFPFRSLYIFFFYLANNIYLYS